MKKLVLLTLLISISSICFAPNNSYRLIFLHEAYQQYVQKEAKERRVLLILKTIRIIESGGDYTIKGATGEKGAYQFMPATWKSYCLLFFNEILDINNPLNQDKVAKLKVSLFIEKGYSNTEIASVWNCGSRYWKGKIGINKKGTRYDVPRHVYKFIKIYEKINKCTNKEVGGYESQVTLPVSEWSNRHSIETDFLFNKRNIIRPYIKVVETDIVKMINLKYKVYINITNTYELNSFIPKTIMKNKLAQESQWQAHRYLHLLL